MTVTGLPPKAPEATKAKAKQTKASAPPRPCSEKQEAGGPAKKAVASFQGR